MAGELTSLTSGASQTRVRVHFLLLKSCVSLGRHVCSLSLSFLICEMGVGWGGDECCGSQGGVRSPEAAAA